jgi:processive 1,2-diacylglycerol beta-glucosyltransferase
VEKDDVACLHAVDDTGLDRLRRRAPAPVPAVDRPEERPPPSRTRLRERRGVEDPVRRPVQRGLPPCGVGDQRGRAPEIVANGARPDAEEVAVQVTVHADLMAGRDDPDDELRSPLDLFADEKERSPDGAECLEYSRRPLGVRPVVEGELDAAPRPRFDAVVPAGALGDRRRRREPVPEHVTTLSDVRVLVLTASVGEGHDLPARVLADELRARGADVVVADGLDELGSLLAGAAEGGMRVTYGSGRMLWLFDLQYLLFARIAPTRALGQRLLYQLGAGRLLRFVLAEEPDVVVSTYPGVTEVLARLRRAGRLDIPVVSAVTDLSALRYWAAPGVDLHLLTHPESVDEVRRIAGPATRVEPVRGLNDPAFLTPPSPEDARRRLELPHEAAVVAVSGGGWGVGDLEGAVRAARKVDGAVVLALCGRNMNKRAYLEHALAGDESVRVLGFVDEMATLLSASDVLVHSTAGLTVLEAHMVGCRSISYGWGVGHIRLNNRAFVRHGIAQVVTQLDELPAAIRAALTQPRVPRYADFAKLPSAAELVLAMNQST